MGVAIPYHKNGHTRPCISDGGVNKWLVSSNADCNQTWTHPHSQHPIMLKDTTDQAYQMVVWMGGQCPVICNTLICEKTPVTKHWQ